MLERFHPAVREWFRATFGEPTAPQRLGWPPIARGESTLLLAPTGTGKTLAAFLSCIERLMFSPAPPPKRRCRVVYVSPLKALAVDIERNLRAPLAGIARAAAARGEPFEPLTVAIRTGDTPAAERSRFRRRPPDILVTTPESLYLILTSQAREALRSVEVVIVDEIHALVPTKRGTHLALSLERLESWAGRRLQRIGLSATQRPLEEIARFLGGVDSDATDSATRRAGRIAAGRRKPGTATAIAAGEAGRQEGAVASSRSGAEAASNAGGGGRIEAALGEASENRLYRPVTIVDAGRKKALELTIEVPVEDLARLGEPPGPPGSSGTANVAPRELGGPQRVALDARGAAPARMRERGSRGPASRTGRLHLPRVVELAARKRSLERSVDGREALPHLPARPGTAGPEQTGSGRPSIWTAIHPRLLELVRAHRSTLLFVNSRRIAERLAAAINELAGETLAQAHHGSVARAQRLEIEERLKAGRLRALVATSSLELGIDMGAIDLVVQIEAPPSVSSGLQRIGRAGHQVGAPSRGVIMPKYRADLLASAAVARAMHDGDVEPVRYPRNPLDVLAQQIVAMVSLERMGVEAVYEQVRRAAPYADLSRPAFTGVLDMLSGRFASDALADLRPRLTWDRVEGTLAAREGARRVAVTNAGTIPDRGLYGVYVAGAARPMRVGELDEEMVFESRVGEVFLLGASSWRIEEITHDRVLVSPAPGEPGKMPFWHGDSAGRPLELGRRIGRLVRELREVPRAVALQRLERDHDLDARAAENLVRYLEDQEAAGAVPDDRTLVVERLRDELGDWRVCVLSPLGGRVHAPWAMAAAAKVRAERGIQIETMWTDDGFVARFPDSDEPPAAELLLPSPEELEALLLGELAATSLFAARFRENAARALLLPKHRPGRRAPLWHTRKRASDLLAAAARFPSFPILLETYRECLRDVFDVPALVSVLERVARGAIRVRVREASTPSPFASAILFGFVAQYLYEGDAPLAERRAQALAIDHAQLRELLGEVELRTLLDADAIAEVHRQLQHLEERTRARGLDGLHDVLLRLGDLARDEVAQRCSGAAHEWIEGLLRERRVVELEVAGEERLVAIENAARYRDALHVALPSGIPESLLEPVADAPGDLAHRHARTHAPFTTRAFADRYGLEPADAEALLRRVASSGRLLSGAFLPGGAGVEWCDPDVLRAIRRRSLARLRHEVDPVDPPVLARLVASWQGVVRRRRGRDALLDVIEQLQGTSIGASILETEVLPARLEAYSPSDLDAVMAAGEVVWCGLAPLGGHDGRIALYLTDHLPRLWRRPPVPDDELDERQRRLVEHLRGHGASFFADLHQAAGGGYPGQTLDAIWALVWKGLVTNDLVHPIRAYVAPRAVRGRTGPSGFRSRRQLPPAAEGRWSLLETRTGPAASETQWSAAMAQQLLARYGLVTREVPLAEALPGGFASIYEVLRAFEESGRIRRGYFVSGVGAMQFALPPVADLLRTLREPPEHPEVLLLEATDPANAYGVLLRWPGVEGVTARGPSRSVGSHVLLVDGALAAWMGRGGRQMFSWVPAEEPERTRVGRALASKLAALAVRAGREGFLIEEIDGRPARTHPLVGWLEEAGFTVSDRGLHYYRHFEPRPPAPFPTAPA